jgi:hypothetical protein
MRRIMGTTLLLLGGLTACRDQGPAGDCTLQLSIAASRLSVPVGGTVGLIAGALPMLPPGGGCGPASLTWSLSDSTLATLAPAGEGSAVLTAVRPGVVSVTTQGTAAGKRPYASVAVTIDAVSASGTAVWQRATR